MGVCVWFNTRTLRLDAIKAFAAGGIKIGDRDQRSVTTHDGQIRPRERRQVVTILHGVAATRHRVEAQEEVVADLCRVEDVNR